MRSETQLVFFLSIQDGIGSLISLCHRSLENRQTKLNKSLEKKLCGTNK